MVRIRLEYEDDFSGERVVLTKESDLYIETSTQRLFFEKFLAAQNNFCMLDDESEWPF